MSESCDRLMQGAFTNNSFSIRSVNRSLKMEYENSYGYLLRLQKNVIRFEHFEMKTTETPTDLEEPFLREFYLDYYMHICTDICHDILDISKKEWYLFSDYYEKEITMQDILDNPVLFTRVPILLIDGRIYSNLTFKYIDGRTEIQIAGLRRSDLVMDGDPSITDYYKKYYILSPHDVKLMVFENVENGQYDYNALGITLYPNRTQLIKALKDDESSLYLCYYTYDTSSRDPVGSTYPYICYQNGEYIVLNFNESDREALEGATNPVLHVFYLANCRPWMWGTSGMTAYAYQPSQQSPKVETTVMVIKQPDGTPYPHPIPVENIILLKQGLGEPHMNLIFGSPKTIELHYPNFYRIIDPDMRFGDNYRAYYFYYDTRKLLPEDADPLDSLNLLGGFQNEYRPMFNFFYDYMLKKLGVRYLENAIDLIVRNRLTPTYFTPPNQEEKRDAFVKRFYELYAYTADDFTVETDITDYVSKWYPLEPGKNSKEKEPFEYKVEQMWKFIHMDEEVLHRYVREQNIVGESFYVFENALNLESRYRTHSSEMGILGAEFLEPMYVFVLETTQKQRPYLNIRVFVDGLYQHYIVHNTVGPRDYIYVPVSSFRKDCMMELEVFPDFEYHNTFDMYFMNQQSKTYAMSIPVDIQPTLADLYVTLDKADQKVFADDFWKLHMVMGDMEIEAFDDEGKALQEFTPLRTYYLTPYRPELFNYGNDFIVNITKKSYLISFVAVDDNCPNIELPWGVVKPEKEYIRIYKNGRLVHPTNYCLTYKTRPLTIQFYLPCRTGDRVDIDVTPYKYKEIYYQERIDFSNPTIDLSGHITKNFCNRYYDVYVNGRKMSWNSCFAISPWLVAMVNLRSSWHFQVFEIDRDDEYFGLDYTTTDRPFSRGDMLDDPYMEEDEKKDLIIGKIEDDKDDDLIIHPNEDEEIPIDGPDGGRLGQIWTYYYGELIPTGFVDPNELQVVREKVAQVFPLIASTYYVEEDAMMLDPNLLIEGERPDLTQAFYYGTNEFLIEKE